MRRMKFFGNLVITRAPVYLYQAVDVVDGAPFGAHRTGRARRPIEGHVGVCVDETRQDDLGTNAFGIGRNSEVSTHRGDLARGNQNHPVADDLARHGVNRPCLDGEILGVKPLSGPGPECECEPTPCVETQRFPGHDGTS